MKRKELKCPVVNEYYGECEFERHKNKYYYKSEADSVMDEMEQRINELEEANKLAVINGNTFLNRIKELETENARLKKQVPVFHFVANGDLPNDKRDVIAFTKFSRYIDNYLGFYHDEHHWRIHDKVIMWCELPIAPSATEESSETEKDGLS